MRVLHAAAFLNPTAGIHYQMECEQTASHELIIEWRTRLFCPAGSIESNEITVFARRSVKFHARLRHLEKAVAWIGLRFRYYRWLHSQSDVDVFILRYYVHDPLQILFMYLCRKPVLLVHHTLEVPELGHAGTSIMCIRAVLERFLGRYSIRKSAAIVGVTKEIIEYEKYRINNSKKPSILYPNGIIFTDSTVADHRSGRQEWLFVASVFYSWHGLDRLLSSLAASSADIVLHVVGEVVASDLEAANSDDRIILHGTLAQEDIRRIAESCCLGISSLALDRKGMTEACTLKAREYLMMGLPVVAGHNDVFPEDFPFFRNLGVDIPAMVEFGDINKTLARGIVAESARPYIDKTHILKKLMNDLEHCLL